MLRMPLLVAIRGLRTLQLVAKRLSRMPQLVDIRGLRIELWSLVTASSRSTTDRETTNSINIRVESMKNVVYLVTGAAGFL